MLSIPHILPTLLIVFLSLFPRSFFCHVLPGTLPYDIKIVIAGNHELTFDQEFMADLIKQDFYYFPSASKLKPENYENVQSLLTNCIYLQDSDVTVRGFRIYGSPWWVSTSTLLSITVNSWDCCRHAWLLVEELFHKSCEQAWDLFLYISDFKCYKEKSNKQKTTTLKMCWCLIIFKSSKINEKWVKYIWIRATLTSSLELVSERLDFSCSFWSSQVFFFQTTSKLRNLLINSLDVWMTNQSSSSHTPFFNRQLA